MRNGIIITVALFISISVSAQSTGYNKKKPWEQPRYNNAKQDSLRKALERHRLSGLDQRLQDEDDMPVLKPKLKKEHLGNNGNGANVYSMKPYNMPGIEPDSTFASKMPVTHKPGRGQLHQQYPMPDAAEVQKLKEELLKKRQLENKKPLTD